MFWYYIIALIIIGIDQWTKWIVVTSMEIGESLPIIDGFFYLTSHRNQGAAWGILQGQMGFFYVVTVIVVIGVIYYMQKYAKSDKWLALGLGLILGGAIGNFIDRLFRQEVVDFFDFYIVTYNFPIFNIADSALTVGVIFVILATILDEVQKGKNKS
ncbi:signal peptidase II [Oceanobacillus senegalensis]|uniref:signal peptidase II n=1 Tax=Oceanobacillus senegalensis TaxID=1936063 RepID=UPI000A30EA2D|nr:signal peptidase II [Oceanobacillus senegalensis]